MGDGAAELLERRDELSRLTQLMRAAAAGSGGALAVVGPAGIGKTRLVSEVVERALPLGLAPVIARGGPLGE